MNENNGMPASNQDDTEFSLPADHLRFTGLGMTDEEAGRFHAWLLRTGRVWDTPDDDHGYNHRAAYLLTLDTAISQGFISRDGRALKAPTQSDPLL